MRRSVFPPSPPSSPGGESHPGFPAVDQCGGDVRCCDDHMGSTQLPALSAISPRARAVGLPLSLRGRSSWRPLARGDATLFATRPRNAVPFVSVHDGRVVRARRLDMSAPPARVYLNVDLEIRSRSNLMPLVAALEPELSVLHAGRIRGMFLASFEVPGPAPSPDVA